MIYPDKGYYSISGFLPPDKNMTMGGYGFSIGLDPEFVKRVSKIEVTDAQLENLENIGRGIVERQMGDCMFPPYTLTEIDGKRTLLLKYCRVNGNACDIGHMGNNSGDRYLPYDSHNVDSSVQAYTLLALWLKWYEIAYAISD